MVNRKLFPLYPSKTMPGIGISLEYHIYIITWFGGGGAKTNNFMMK